MLANRSLILLGAVFIAAMMRLLPHPPNMAPMAAIALLAGSKSTSRWQSFGLVLGAMFLSDLVIGFHSTLPFVYVAFAITILVGEWLRERKGVASLAGATFGSSLMFFFLTNFGVWATQNLYPKSAAGLLACYTAAVPFFSSSLVGDFMYVGIFFGLFCLTERISADKPATASVG